MLDLVDSVLLVFCYAIVFLFLRLGRINVG